MSDTKHTPGPWGVPDESTHLGRVKISAGGSGEWNGLVAEADAGTYARSQEEGLANAHLIARAPEMAAEIERLRAENRRVKELCRRIYLRTGNVRRELDNIKELASFADKAPEK